MTPAYQVLSLLLTAFIATFIIALALGSLLGASCQHRRNREERAMYHDALGTQRQRADDYRDVAQRLAQQMEEQSETHRAQVEAMRLACEDQLLWAFRDRNRMAARLAMLERGHLEPWPQIEWSDN